MILWKSFGASVVGPGHIATGKPNQDAWGSFHHVWVDGIAISDGLGSKLFSNFGSDAACSAVACAANACREMAEINYGFLSNRIKTNWLSQIAPLEPATAPPPAYSHYGLEMVRSAWECSATGSLQSSRWTALSRRCQRTSRKVFQTSPPRFHRMWPRQTGGICRCQKKSVTQSCSALTVWQTIWTMLTGS